MSSAETRARCEVTPLGFYHCDALGSFLAACEGRSLQLVRRAPIYPTKGEKFTGLTIYATRAVCMVAEFCPCCGASIGLAAHAALQGVACDAPAAEVSP